MKRSLLLSAVVLPLSLVRADLTNYWALSETSGSTAPNSVATGVPGTLFGNAAWTTDPVRGDVLQLDGASYVEAGTLPEFLADQEFTWAFWANSAQTANDNVIVGNRFPDEGWVKFTTNAFEFKDFDSTFDASMDYPDIPAGAWMHHAVVKRGPLFTYYRDGLAQRQVSLFADAPSVPLFFGGDMFQENWAGLLDDVATWTSAVPTSSVAALAAGTATPLNAPLVSPPPPATVVAFTDSFTTLNAWTPANRGLESTVISTYDPPSIVNGELVLGGTTNAQFWLGTSVVSNQAFDSRLFTEVEVARVSLTGSGTAYRSSLWIFGDDSHYLHFSQNVGETGWQFNAFDGGGQGTLNQIGIGTNIVPLDGLDSDTGPNIMAVRLLPIPGTNGRLNMELLLNGEVVAVHGFSQFPTSFRVILTGQARAANDTVSAVFDNLLVRRENATNLPPSFSPSVTAADAVTEGGALSFNAAALASDTENNPLVFSKTTGPDWISVSSAGLVTGTAPAGSAGFVSFGVQVLDTVGLGTAQLTVRMRVEPAGLTPPPLLGWWPLNEGSGEVVRDASGMAADGIIFNPDTGGLGENGSAWSIDPIHGPVLSFNGNERTIDPAGAFVLIGDSPGAYALPLFTLEDSFAWSLWVRPEQAANNDIILGNRYDSNGVDFVPSAWVKFTGSAFEWHFNAVGEAIDFPDLPASTWMHLVVVKEGPTLYYYRDGEVVDGRTITGAPTASLPLYFAGQGVENWRGYLADVRLFTGSLSEQTVQSLFQAGPSGPVEEGFFISSIVRGPSGSITVTWPSQPGESYDIQWSTSLAVGSWSTVAGPLTATEGTTASTLPAGGTPDPATAPVGFLRVRRLQ